MRADYRNYWAIHSETVGQARPGWVRHRRRTCPQRPRRPSGPPMRRRIQVIAWDRTLNLRGGGRERGGVLTRLQQRFLMAHRWLQQHFTVLLIGDNPHRGRSRTLRSAHPTRLSAEQPSTSSWDATRELGVPGCPDPAAQESGTSLRLPKVCSTADARLVRNARVTRRKVCYGQSKARGRTPFRLRPYGQTRAGDEASRGLFRLAHYVVNYECRDPNRTVKSLFPTGVKSKEVGHELRPVRARRPEH